MDKSWINLSTRANDEYINGVVSFLDFAFARSTKDGKILCPCTKCVNTYYVSRAEAFDHIICKGFLKGYVRWIFHGESSGAHTSTSRSDEEELQKGKVNLNRNFRKGKYTTQRSMVLLSGEGAIRMVSALPP